MTFTKTDLNLQSRFPTPKKIIWAKTVRYYGHFELCCIEIGLIATNVPTPQVEECQILPFIFNHENVLREELLQTLNTNVLPTYMLIKYNMSYTLRRNKNWNRITHHCLGELFSNHIKVSFLSKLATFRYTGSPLYKTKLVTSWGKSTETTWE